MADISQRNLERLEFVKVWEASRFFERQMQCELDWIRFHNKEGVLIKGKNADEWVMLTFEKIASSCLKLSPIRAIKLVHFYSLKLSDSEFFCDVNCNKTGAQCNITKTSFIKSLKGRIFGFRAVTLLSRAYVPF